MNQDHQAKRRVAFVGDRSDVEFLQALLPREVCGLAIDHFRESSFYDQAIIWLSRDDLKAPGAGDDEARRRWAQIIHLISRRLHVQLFRVTKERGLNDLVEWQQRFESEIDPKIQSPVRARGDVLIIVFERNPQSSEVDELARRSTDNALYLMMPELRVEQTTPRLAHSIHVWHEAVIRLLSRLLAHQPPQPGIYAWRGLEVRAGGGRSAPDGRQKEELDRFISWLCTVESLPRERSSEDSENGAIETTTTGKSIAQAKPEKIKEPDTSNEEGTLLDFAGMESNSAEHQVVEIASTARVEGQARAAGGKWRISQAETPARLLQIERELAGSWMKISQMEPPEGGPGLANELCLSLASRIEAAQGAQAVAAQQKRWSDEFAKDNEDIGARNYSLRQMARELQRARDHLVGLVQRAVLGLFCALIVGFILAQAMESWSGIWWGGLSLGAIPTRELILLVTFAVCGGLGVAAGVVLPYLLETWRGRVAARVLWNEAVNLRKRMVERLNRRLDLCHKARVLAATFTGLAVRYITKLLAGRANEVIKGSFNSHLTGFEKTTAGLAFAGASQEPSFDLAAFHDLLTLTIQVNSKNDEPQPVAQASLKPPSCFRQALDPWKAEVPKIDFKDAGWLPQRQIPGVLDQVFRKLLESSAQETETEDSGSGKILEIQESNLGALKTRLERWYSRFSNPRENLGMMSLHFNIIGTTNEFDLKTLVASPYSNLLKEVTANIQKVRQDNPETYTGPLLWGENVLVEVFQELLVSFDKSNVDRKGAAWFSPGPAGPNLRSAGVSE